MIKGFDENKIGNPIRNHINISFEKVSDREEMLKKIVEDLSKNLDAEKSTALIFVPTRKGTEDATRELNILFEENKLHKLHNKIDFFHAGLDSSEREEKYLNFKQGKLLILVATKAFGMGMDIKNIHYVYHLGPSSTFEDYLQEVGRAGRNAEILKEAGFSEENQIKTKCLYTYQDFNSLRDKLHKNQITWTHLVQVKEAIFDYVKKFKPITENDENSFPLPLDLLDYVPEFKDRIGKDTFFRVCLYWLEKLNRIRLGVFTPTYLPISIVEQGHTFRNIANETEKSILIKFHQNLVEYKKNNFPEADSIMISITELKELSSTSSTADMFKFIFRAQQCKLIVVEREMLLEPTRLRMAELNNGIRTNSYPLINATFSFSKAILEKSTPGSQKSYEPDELDDLIKPVIYEMFKPNFFNWIEQKGSNGNENYTNQELTEKSKNDFIKKRAKFAFKLLSFVPKIKHKSNVVFEKGYEKPITTQLIFNGSRSIENQNNYIDVFKNDLIRLINIVAKNYIKNQRSNSNIIDLINELGIENKGDEYLQNLLFIARGLGYLKGEGSLIPMGIELFIKDTESFQDEVKGTSDYNVKEEFLDTGKMKQLRLLALECLSERPHQEQDMFIKNFFKCGNTKELLELLEIHFSENNPVLSAFREEALKEEVKRLNPQQLKVYETKLNKNIQVIAGPGSGKTHTLTLRIAKLIHEEKINPETILVLAYNRAVVVELKERLTKLFKNLGYSKLIKNLKVFTFHGFAKYCLGQQLNDLNFENWTEEFINKMNESPGLINQRIGLIKYVFVDEFQDITYERLELLKFIANPNQTKICVIGDPNQSIYGYQRDQKGEPMEPQPYYNEFKKIYKPIELNLNINYRSYPLILEEAEKLLALNETRYEMPKLEAFLQPSIKNNYCKVVKWAETRIDWKQKVKDFVNYRDDDNQKYNQIAVMFRSNDEVYRAFNILKIENIQNVKIRIQGAKGSIYKTREFFYFTSIFQKNATLTLEKNYIEIVANLKNDIIRKHPNWNEYFLDIFHCILFEFDKDKDEESTYQDLNDFIKEISQKDDGQFGKIYNQNIGLIKSDYINQEIIITTMHKVKGIEYDAVIIPASLTNLPSIPVEEKKIKDYIEEERRLYYVAYTRAKKELFVIKHLRENALDEGIPSEYSENTIRNNYGLKIKEGIDKFTMYWSASRYGVNSFEYIRDKVKIGDPIYLIKQVGVFTFWHVIHNNQVIAQLSASMAKYLNDLQFVSGFVVSAVYVSTYKETLESDLKRNDGKKYAENWTQEAKERGYIYLIDFSGFGN